MRERLSYPSLNVSPTIVVPVDIALGATWPRPAMTWLLEGEGRGTTRWTPERESEREREREEMEVESEGV